MLSNQEAFHLSQDLSLQTAYAFADLEFAIDDDRTMNNGVAIVILHYCPSASTPEKKKGAQILLPACSCFWNRMTSNSSFLEWRGEQVLMTVQHALAGPGGRRLGLAT